MKLPDRGSSLTSDDNSRRQRRPSRSEGKSSKPKPDPARTRTWTDRSGSFKVEAQFIGLTDGKIHLHKANGVKIAVPITKMAPEDLAYVEKAAGVSLDEDKPLGDLKRKKRPENGTQKGKASQPGASVENPKGSQYDWFDFFLKAGVGPHQCERYAQNMTRDSMDESNLPDVTSEVLRTLGLKEGDILRVMKHLDNVYGRSGKSGDGQTIGANGSAGGLFSTTDGTLRNNTRKGRPESNRVVSDVVDEKVFEQSDGRVKSRPPDSRATPLTSAPVMEKAQRGFEDNAWEVNPVKESTSSAPQPTSTTQPPSVASAQPKLTGAMAELSLLSPPLQPTIASPLPVSQAVQPEPIQQQRDPSTNPASAMPQQGLPTGANPSFFGQLNPQQTGLPGSQLGLTQQPSMQPQNTNFQQMPQLYVPRQRPQAPQQPLSPGALLGPPPRPLSAPQNFQQQTQFGPPPLQPQLTGIPHSSALQAPLGHSLNDLSQQRLQQQYMSQQHLQPQNTGLSRQGPGFSGFNSNLMVPQPSFQPQGQQFSGPQQQPYINGNAIGSPFADPRPQLQPQPTGFGYIPPGGINSVLPPPLQPQPTGFRRSSNNSSNHDQPASSNHSKQATNHNHSHHNSLQRSSNPSKPASSSRAPNLNTMALQAPPLPTFKSHPCLRCRHKNNRRFQHHFNRKRPVRLPQSDSASRMPPRRN